jgi:cell division septal protein FtsQ
VENRRARHISEIIRERHNRSAQNRAAAPNPKRVVLKILRLLLGAMLDVLATIGWLVTLPFITRDDRAFTARAQSGG